MKEAADESVSSYLKSYQIKESNICAGTEEPKKPTADDQSQIIGAGAAHESKFAKEKGAGRFKRSSLGAK